ncbi:MAG: hypothetical protein V1725_02630 [archaeon]
MRFTPQMMSLGCVTSLVSLGALVSGIYQGIADAKGVPIDPSFRTMIKYGPIALNGILGIPMGVANANVPENIDEIVQSNPYVDREQAEGCAKGCSPIITPIIGAGITTGVEYLGYLIGQGIGHHT